MKNKFIKMTEGLPESFIEVFSILVREECTGNNTISYSFNDEGFQRVEVIDDGGEVPWFTVSLTYKVEEDGFETVAKLATNILIDIIEKEIGKAIDEKASLN